MKAQDLTLDEIIYKLKILEETVPSIEENNDVYWMIKALEKLN